MSLFSKAVQEQRKKQAEQARQDLEKGNIRFMQLEIPDNNGLVRGKLCGVEKGLSTTGTGMSTLTLAFRSGDELCITTPFSNLGNGFPKMVAVPDYDTLVKWPWEEGMAAILCDFYGEDGHPCPLDGRHILKKIIAEFAELDLEPRFALEFEVYIFRACAEALRQKRYLDLHPWAQGWDCYSLTRYPSQEFREFGKTFLSRMAGIGIQVEAFHTELGNGMYEFPLAHAPALKAADDATRARLYLKQLCHEYELVPSFMAATAPQADDSMTGCHHNLSLWRGGKNVFWDGDGQQLSELGRHFAGGLLATMPDFNLLFRPWVNSYHRTDPMKWCPANASWGLDNHTVALRVVHGPAPEKYTRFEHRLAATDINPYLSIAAILAGGLHGIRNRIEPPDYATGNAIDNPQFKPLTASMPQAITDFRDSAVTRELLGQEVVEHYAIVKQEEWDDFSGWAAENDHDAKSGEVSQWELEHYFLWC